MPATLWWRFDETDRPPYKIEAGIRTASQIFCPFSIKIPAPNLVISLIVYPDS